MRKHVFLPTYSQVFPSPSASPSASAIKSAGGYMPKASSPDSSDIIEPNWWYQMLMTFAGFLVF
jgi:hypothetical protein